MFFFSADGATAGQVAEAISDFYQVSVLIQGSANTRTISGRLVAPSLKEALDSFAFLLGVPQRSLPGSGVYLFGGDKETVFVRYPSYGLKGSEIEGVLKEGARIVADQVVMETDQVRAAQVRDVLQSFGDRQSLLLEILMVDIAATSTDRVNAWLDQFSVGVGFVAKSIVVPGVGALPAVANNAGVIQGALAQQPPQFQKYAGPVYDISAQGLLAFLETEKGSKVKLREQVQILSGGKSVFGSGQLVETTLFVRQAQTDNNLVQQVERRTVGLEVTLGVQSWGDKWHIDLMLTDSALAGGAEQQTHLTTERIMERSKSGYYLLASFTRDNQDHVESKVPVLGSIPGIRKAFTKGQTVTGQRQVLVMARPIWDQQKIVSELEAVAIASVRNRRKN